MHPELFRLGPFTVKSYGALLALSFLLGVLWSIRRAKRAGVDPKYILDLAIVIFISSIVGARAFYVIFHLDEFRGHWLDIISAIQSNGDLGIGGLTMLGGVILAIVSGIFYLRLKKQNVWQVADVLAPAFPLGIFLTRIGCFLNGCCFGKPVSDHAWVIIFVLVLFLERFKTFQGYSFWLMLALFGLGRFIIDFYRYYEPSMVLTKIGPVAFSVNQGVSIIIIVISAAMWNYLRLKPRRQIGHESK